MKILRFFFVKSRLIVFLYSILVFAAAHPAAIQEKVLICGVGRNIEKAVPNTIASAEKLGAQFLDYRVIIYENNSKDKTKELIQEWAENNSRVIFASEHVRHKELASQLSMKKVTRTEAIARARNKVLDIAMQDVYSDFKYVIWVDIDFLTPWDVSNIVDTILHPEQEWDAVLGNGAYDLFALRTPLFPIGFELIGMTYWNNLDEIRSRFVIDKKGPWISVYSAFGGVGIYKREAIKNCRYSGVVTKDLEQMMLVWLKEAEKKEGICFMREYQALLKTTKVVDLTDNYFSKRKSYPDVIGVRLHNENGIGKIVWFSCTRSFTLPSTCEHIPFHASMAVRGHGRIFINPRLISG